MRLHVDTPARGLHGGGLGRLDPRTRLICALIVTVWIGVLPIGREGALAVLALAMLTVGWLANARLSTLVLRACAALPFVTLPALVGLLDGTFDPARVAGIAARAWTAALVAVLLVAVTPLPALMAAAARLGAPSILVQTITLIARYLVVLRERGAAMMASARARGYGAATPRRFAVGGAMLGTLLIRSLDRSERVHRAMLARGYSGSFPSRGGSLHAGDWLIGGAILAGAVLTRIWL